MGTTTSTTTPAGVPFIDFTREFDAPRRPRLARLDRARAAHAVARTATGSRCSSTSTTSAHGGRYRYIHKDTDGNEYGFHGVFHGTPSPDSFVQTFEFEGAPGHVSLDTLVLEDLGGGRTRAVMHSVYQSVEARDAMVASGMESGIDAGLRAAGLAARAPQDARSLKGKPMDWKLEVVVLPVTDVDRAKAFYSEQIGFVVDVDQDMGACRVVQMTPPGSGCSVTIGRGLNDAAPGSVKGMQLCVGDIEAARAELVERGVAVSPIRHVGPEGLGGRQRRRVELVHLLRRPGRQLVGRPGEPDPSRRARGGDRRGLLASPPHLATPAPIRHRRVGASVRAATRRPPVATIRRARWMLAGLEG